ncbi:hypothetical protein QLX55_10290 [Solobacterium moorei]|uniref:hypothetical protein n=1 Tax=Solobacterium moorei TaxID=102148 RepID=UPI0024AD5630|nr:hypothetical protein [Solobacterium moorei]MDI6415713.1 hypothetical protein [Solobacterium moorei]
MMISNNGLTAEYRKALSRLEIIIEHLEEANMETINYRFERKTKKMQIDYFTLFEAVSELKALFPVELMRDEWIKDSCHDIQEEIRELPTDDLNFLADSFKGRSSTDIDADELLRRSEAEEFTESEYFQLHRIIRGMENAQ